MKKYLVLVYGRNFRISIQGRRGTAIKLTGFYTTRCVAANDSIDAE